ncbi:MAG: molybdopterin-dependent oxidoreductase [Variibacter sp.]|nr:molybdopterin-dependent oxidoreductase [Variibacter sp.]
MADDPPVAQAEREALRLDLRQSDDDLRLPALFAPGAFPLETIVPQAREQTRAVGQRVTRPDSRPHGLGPTRYIDDLALPGMLHAKIKRAGIASARIRHIDTSAAERMPGVFAVVTGAEFPTNSFGPSIQDQPVLADKQVFHAGDGVAAVAAATEAIAAEAAERIVVEYEPLPAVFDPVAAMEPSAHKVHGGESNVYVSKRILQGDVEAALAAAPRVFEGTFRTQMIEHAPMEPHAAIAEWDTNGRVTLWATIGRIVVARGDIARVLRLPINRVRIIGTSVGGNFGGKNEITQEPALALLAKKAGRPVKGVLSRREEFTSTTTRHPFVMEIKSGVALDGRILARKVRLVLDGGAYCSWTETTLGKACILACGPYQVPNLLVEAFAVYTNKTMTGAMRGFGAPQVCFAYESHMDDIATALKLDPLQIRLLNAFDEGSESPTGQVLESVTIKDTLIKGAERFGWSERQT